MSLRAELRRMCLRTSGKDIWVHIRYLFSFWNFLKRVKIEHVEALHTPPDTTAILLSYRRPQNIDALLSILLKVPSISTVVISNNNASIDLRPYIRSSRKRITLLQSVIDRPCHYRQYLAEVFPAKQYLFIDDDLFLMPSAIEELLQHLRLDPSRVHGYFGELRDEWTSQTYHGVHGYTFSMENLNRVYACTNIHIVRFMELARKLHCTPSSAHWIRNPWWDDIVLSYSGDRKSQIHSLQTPFFNCITSDDPRVAQFRQPDFHSYRDQMRRAAQKITSLPA